jgi:hypothetical protein
MNQQQPAPLPLDRQQANQLLTLTALARRAKTGANNFYWIAGLSVINSMISTFGGSVTFVIGLGITQLVDAFASIFSQEVAEAALLFKIIGLVLSILLSGVFALFGFFAGMILYGLDALLLLLFKDWIGFLFHLYFMWGLWNGLGALNQLQKLTAQTPGFPSDIGIS